MSAAHVISVVKRRH